MAAAAGVVLLGACGGDDDDGGSATSATSDEGEAYVDAIATSMREDGEVPLDAERADCAATAIVDVVGVDTLRDAGISPEELGDADSLQSLDVEVPDDVTERLGAAFDECGFAGTIKDALVDSFTSEFGSELSAEASACLRDNLSDEAVTDALAATFVDGSNEHVQEPLLAAVAACPPVATEALLAEAPTDLPPAAEACVSEFVESNPDLVARSFGSGDAAAGQELGVQLAGACPEVAAALGTRGG
jgi:hypothetical protein